MFLVVITGIDIPINVAEVHVFVCAVSTTHFQYDSVKGLILKETNNVSAI